MSSRLKSPVSCGTGTLECRHDPSSIHHSLILHHPSSIIASVSDIASHPRLPTAGGKRLAGGKSIPHPSSIIHHPHPHPIRFYATGFPGIQPVPSLSPPPLDNNNGLLYPSHSIRGTVVLPFIPYQPKIRHGMWYPRSASRSNDQPRSLSTPLSCSPTRPSTNNNNNNT